MHPEKAISPKTEVRLSYHSKNDTFSRLRGKAVPHLVPKFGCKDTKKEQSFELLFFLCHIVPDYRTFIDDYLKILDFIEWLKVAYPEKAEFLTEKS